MLDDLPTLDDQLRDPKSQETSQQPKYAQNAYRSIKSETLVLVGICTHLGCSPTFRPDVAPADLGPNWKSGFSVPATVPASTWPAASTRACPRRSTWKCLPIGI